MPRLFVFSGAGLSAESGVSTFRGDDGLWNNHRIDQVCSEHTWKANFDLVHSFYNELREGLAGVTANAAHKQIAQWCTQWDTTVFTQNVDDLLERAGVSNVIHLHGKLREMRCTACGHEWDIGHTAWNTADHCANAARNCLCRKGVRPNVVFFGGSAPLYARLWKTLRELTADDVVVVVGTSSRVIPIEQELERVGFAGTAYYVNIQDLPPDVPNVYQHHVIAPAGKALMGLTDQLAAHGFSQPV